MTAASTSSPVAVDPAVDTSLKGANDSLAWLSAHCMTVREQKERGNASCNGLGERGKGGRGRTRVCSTRVAVLAGCCPEQ
jgi:hypothetical protein